MKHTPNIISGIRILLSITLLTTPIFSSPWLLIYYICGFSDMVDGYIARSFHLESALGAFLDSVADFLMVSVVLIQLFVTQRFPTYLIILVAVLFILKTITLLIGHIKFKRFAWLHTDANKLSGFFTFILMPLYYQLPSLQNIVFITLTCLTLYAAGEELLITLTRKDVEPNIKSIFS